MGMKYPRVPIGVRPLKDTWKIHHFFLWNLFGMIFLEIRNCNKWSGNEENCAVTLLNPVSM